jgi:sec-independent protein translocase protein TatA
MNFGMTEVLIIALIIIFLFGAKKLPELAKSLGSSVKSFKKGLNEAQDKDNQDTDK